MYNDNSSRLTRGEHTGAGQSMNLFVSLLRGVNVGGKTVRTADLVAVYRTLGLGAVETYLQSGNVIFEAPRGEAVLVSAAIEKGLGERFGFEVKVLVRTGDELRRIVAENPFLTGEDIAPTALHVTFLSGIPGNLPSEGAYGGDRYALRGREVFLVCPNGYGRTKFPNAFFERGTGVFATTRNWRTVTTLALMAGVKRPGLSQ